MAEEKTTAATKEGAAHLKKTVQKQPHRNYSAEEKVRIVLEGLRHDQTVAELCRKEGLQEDVYLKWLREFVEAGKCRLKREERQGDTGDELDRLQEENRQLREAVAELTIAAQMLKKSSF